MEVKKDIRCDLNVSADDGLGLVKRIISSVGRGSCKFSIVMNVGHIVSLKNGDVIPCG